MPTVLELVLATLTEALCNKLIALPIVPQSGMHTGIFLFCHGSKYGSLDLARMVMRAVLGCFI